MFVRISIAFCVVLTGCCDTRPKRIATTQSILFAVAHALSTPSPDDDLKAVIVPPIGWKAEPPKVSDSHRHQVWLSPTGDTAYGIIYFKLPFPVGSTLALRGFLSQMKQSEGEATLIVQKDTPDGIYFEAEGGLYRIRCNLSTAGFHGWAVYAGTIRKRPTNAAELQTAIDAREQTRVNLP